MRGKFKIEGAKRNEDPQNKEKRGDGFVSLVNAARSKSNKELSRIQSTALDLSRVQQDANDSNRLSPNPSRSGEIEEVRMITFNERHGERQES